MKRIAAAFFAALLVLTLISHKIDVLRTPEVVGAVPRPGRLPGEGGVPESFGCVIPVEALHRGADGPAVYLIEETLSHFSPVVARRAEVEVLAEADGMAAVSGLLSGGPPVVLYASRELSGGAVPVRLLEEGGE